LTIPIRLGLKIAALDTPSHHKKGVYQIMGFDLKVYIPTVTRCVPVNFSLFSPIYTCSRGISNQCLIFLILIGSGIIWMNKATVINVTRTSKYVMRKAPMKNPMIVTVIVPVVIALASQAYILVQLTAQVSQLSDKMSQPDSQQWVRGNLPILTPAKPSCDRDVFDQRREFL
jgi:hypothetical protein